MIDKVLMYDSAHDVAFWATPAEAHNWEQYNPDVEQVSRDAPEYSVLAAMANGAAGHD